MEPRRRYDRQGYGRRQPASAHARRAAMRRHASLAPDFQRAAEQMEVALSDIRMLIDKLAAAGYDFSDSPVPIEDANRRPNILFVQDAEEATDALIGWWSASIKASSEFWGFSQRLRERGF